MTADELLVAIRSRLNEMEGVTRVAVARDGEHWHATDDGDVCTTGADGSGYFAVGPWGGSLFETGEHIALHDPSSVLRRVAADRRIANWCAAVIRAGADGEAGAALGILEDLADGLGIDIEETT